MQTNLEKQGIEARKENILQNNTLGEDKTGYNKDDKYGLGHKNTLGGDDVQGKGTTFGGHTHTAPNPDKGRRIDYSTFNTDNGGNMYDIKRRSELEIMSLYNEDDEYSAIHKNALSDKSAQGKGTSFGGHTHTIPNPDKPRTINYSAFNTDNGGNIYDVESRGMLETISLYSKETPYGAHMIDTSANKVDGQIII